MYKIYQISDQGVLKPLSYTELGKLNEFPTEQEAKTFLSQWLNEPTNHLSGSFIILEIITKTIQ